MKYLTHRFIEGLCREIRNAVILQRPRDLESALAVASLQEEVLEVSTTSGSKEFKRSDSGASARTNLAFKGAMPLPLPPGRTLSTLGKDLRTDNKKGPEVVRSSGGIDKVSSLKAQRRAQGLCYICTEKWSPTHKCASSVQLHAVQEIFSLLMNEDSDSLEHSVAVEETLDQSLMAISLQAIQGSEHSGSMRMLGYVQGFEVLILVDSGSSASFISSKVAVSLQGMVPIKKLVQVKVANVTVLPCSAEILNCEWTTQGPLFHTNFKVLQLGNYDIILGKDWLMHHSPMQVDWVAKSLCISYKGQTITL